MFQQAKSRVICGPFLYKVLVNTLIKHIENDTKIAAITGAMPSGTGLDLFQKNFLKECLMLELPNNME